MWKMRGLLFLTWIIPFLAVGIGMIYFGFQASPAALTDDGYPLKNFLYTLGAFFVIFPLILSVAIMLFVKRSQSKEINLIEHGIQGEAEILSRGQTGIYVNNLPQIKFLFKITTSYGEIYELEHKEVVSMLNLNDIKVGAKLPVFIDPDNNKNILIVYS